MKNSNKVSQVVKIVINQKKKKKTRRKVKKAKALGTLADILNFQRFQNSFTSNPPNNGLNAGDVLNIINSKMPKTYTTGMLDGRPIKLEVGMEGKELERKILEKYLDTDGDGRISSKEEEELDNYTSALEKKVQELTPYKTAQKLSNEDKLESNLLSWITKKEGQPLRSLYNNIRKEVARNIKDNTMKGRLNEIVAKRGSEEYDRLVGAFYNEVGDSSFDDASTGGTAQQLIFGGDGTSQEDSGGI